MAYKERITLDADTAIALGGKKKDGTPNPTKIEGYFLGSTDKKSEMSKTGLCKFHIFLTQKGKVGVWGKTDLDRRMLVCVPGQMTLVTFTGYGDKKPGKHPMYLFKAEQDEENTMDVSEISGSQESTETYAEDETINDGFSEEEPEDEPAVDEDETPVDEAPPTRAAPKKVAAPTAASQKKIQDLMKSRKSA